MVTAAAFIDMLGGRANIGSVSSGFGLVWGSNLAWHLEICRRRRLNIDTSKSHSQVINYAGGCTKSSGYRRLRRTFASTKPCPKLSTPQQRGCCGTRDYFHYRLHYQQPVRPSRPAEYYEVRIRPLSHIPPIRQSPRPVHPVTVETGV